MWLENSGQDRYRTQLEVGVQVEQLVRACLEVGTVRFEVGREIRVLADNYSD